MKRPIFHCLILATGMLLGGLAGCGDDDASDSSDTTGGDTTGGDTTGGDTTGGDTTGGDAATGAYLAPTDDCPQRGGFLDVNNRDNFIDYNGDGNDNADTFNNTGLSPSIDVECANGTVSVTSNGIVNFDYYAIGPDGSGGTTQDREPEASSQTFEFPADPSAAAQTTALPTEGTVAVMANGVQIFGPNEALQDNGADPYLHGLLDYCGGHVNIYHQHSFPECFFGYPTLGGASSLLPEGSAGVVLGYALDGFPILAPYECTDTDCTEVLPVASSWDYDTSATWAIQNQNLSGDCATDDSGGYSDNYAWDCNVFNGQKSDTATTLYADQCNGRTRPDGTYAYYATRAFPYFLGCFTGTATNAGGGNAPGGGGGGGPPPGG